jgi:ATP-dependent exoDNAse (exonuclease V) beta subunit
MSGDLKDKKARDRIRDRIDTGMAVEAAAGTGKTTAMVSRIMSLIKSGVSMQKIAAITFTEKAAAELELRVREELEGALVDGDALEPGQRETIEAALSELDRAQISTIHAFALSMIKERPVEAEVDPGAEIMDDLQDALWFPESWQAWLAGLDRSSRETLARAARAGIGLEKIEGLAGSLAANRDVAKILKRYLESEGRVTLETAQDKIKELEVEAEKLFRDCERWNTDPDDIAFQTARSWAGFIRGRAGREASREAMESFLEVRPAGVIRLSGGRQGNWESKERLSEVKTRLKEQRSAIEEVQELIRTMIMNQALVLICGFVENDWKRRRQAAWINFQDVLILARDLLMKEEAGEYYKKKWKHLLVDEFQDTDPLQVQIIDRLFDDDQRLKGLFLVGDPKQSIYRCRRADISVYRKKVEEICTRLSQKTETLKTNFRSVPGIIDWVNHEFKKIIRERGAHQAKYVEMEPSRGPGENPLPPVSALHPVDDSFTGMYAREVRVMEADHIAALIERLVGSGKYRVKEKPDSDPLPLSHRHIAVLFFTRPGNGEEWLKPFLQRGIPFVTDIGRSFFKRDEAAAVHSALKAIEDPSDSLSLFAALRSPLMGFSDEELLNYKRALPDEKTLDYRQTEIKGFPELDRAFALFGRLHKERNERPVAQTVDELISMTGLKVSALVHRRDDTGVMDLERFIGLARAYQDVPGADFTGFVSRLEDLAELDVESREPVTLDPGEDFVRFSTVHSAKGLEFPVVIIANLTSGARRPAGDILVDRLSESRAAAMSGGRKNGFKSSGYDQMAEDEESHLFEESKRLLYVAATRARDALIFSVFPPYPADALPGEHPDGMKSAKYLDLLPEYMKTWDPDRRQDPESGVVFWDSSKLDLDYEKRGKTEKDDKKTGSKPADLKKFEEGRKKLIENAARSIEVRTATGGGPEEPEEVFDDKGAAQTIRTAGRGEAILVGSVVHAIMEDVDITAAKADEALVRARSRNAGLEARWEEIWELVNNCLDSGPVKRAVASGSFHKEAPYSVWIGEVLHEGRIDLLFREGGRMVVVDYKTDHVSEKEIPGRLDEYRGQGDEYRRAVRRATGAEDIEVWLVFARPGVALELK